MRRKSILNLCCRILFPVFIVVSCQNEQIGANHYYDGMELKHIVAQKGKNYSESEFLLDSSTSLYEYQSELYYLIDSGKVTRVKQLTWKRDERTEVVWFVLTDSIWLHVGNISWTHDIQF